MIKLFKSLFLSIAMTTIAAAACSCSGDKTDEPKGGDSGVTINVTPENIDAPCEASSASLSVSANADWSISSDADWCKIFPSGGLKNSTSKIDVTISAYTGASKRQATLTINAGSSVKKVIVTQQAAPTLSLSTSTICFGAQQGSATINVTANVNWVISTGNAAWITVSPTTGADGSTAVTVSCEANSSETDRETTVTFSGDGIESRLKIVQYSDVINTPDGYTLVWNDEFNSPDGSQPDLSKWYYDEWPAGYVNNELQRYVAGSFGNEKTAEIINGVLNITARKSGSQVISARLNTRELWQYGYFEARLKLPKGKGTWPAFWMMPADGGNWPHCGEIDIMEEVGTNPNYTSSSIHCTSYNHTIGTQKTAERLTAGAEDEFHIYALEWTPDYIRTYVDGNQLFYFANDKKGDENTWPFDKPFHPILNLAWGGSWGGMNGVDESALPATYMIDYVRVFQQTR